jgi:hypothetical protein
VDALAEFHRAAGDTVNEFEGHRAVPPSRGKPPDTEHEWLDTAQVAEHLGISRVAVNQRCLHDRVPFTEHAGQRWIRFDHLLLIQQAQAAREAAFSRSRWTASPPQGPASDATDSDGFPVSE